jgi:putative membrane protein
LLCEGRVANVILHGVFSGPFLLAWDFQPYIIFVLVFAAGLYFMALRRIAERGVRSVPRSYPLYFYTGLGALAVAAAGPLESYNENSFALHMGQHVVMMLIAAPLIVLGRPVHVALWALDPKKSGAIVGPFLRQTWLRSLLTVIAHPLVVLLLINVNLVVWHLPGFYQAALENTLVHELEHALFMGTAVLFWWVIIDPIPRHHKIRPDFAIGMLFITGSVGDLLGLYLIFSQEIVYPFYLVSETIFGMSQLADQRVGGLIMLVTGTVVFFGATFLLIARNYGNTVPYDSRTSEEAERGQRASELV